MTDEQTRVYEVTQADRDAVQRFHQIRMDRLMKDIHTGSNTLEGTGKDTDDIYQAFARHAHEATAPLIAENAKLREALTPSADTKAAYIGEFGFNIVDRDEDGEEVYRRVTVPWDTTKEIMSAIAARAALEAAK